MTIIYDTAGAQNSVKAYAELGHSTVSNTVGGIGTVYKHEFNSRFEVGGGLQLNNRLPDFFGSLVGNGAFRFKIGMLQFRLDDQLLYRSFGSYGLNEVSNGLTLGWESKHVTARLGNAFQILAASDRTTFDGWMPMFEGTLRLKGPAHPWNVGLFVRNFDDFAFDGLTSVRWGAVGECNVGRQTSVFANITVRTAGNANATAGIQEWYIRIGGTYRW